MSIVYFDIETGGLKLEHPIIQLAAIAVSPEWNEIETFERKIAFDETKADPDALALNHYDSEVWRKEALPEARVVGEFAALLNRHRSVELVSQRTGRPYSVARVGGHSASFDVDRVSAMFKRHNTFFGIEFKTVLDTRYGAIWHFERRPPEQRPKDYKLTTLAQHFGIEVNGAHDALVDVRLSIAIAKRLLDGQAS